MTESILRHNNLDFKNICRICLQNASESIDLFTDREESQNILEIISECFQIILNSDNYLACIICNDCVIELKKAHALRTKYVTINERFKEYCETILKKSEEEVNEGPVIDLFNDNTSICNDNSCHESNKNTGTNNQSYFECEVCHKELKSMKSLLKHMVCMHEKRRHVGKVSGFGSARRYHCNSCSYSTPHSQTLVNHMRRHNGDRPFICECGKSFTQASSLSAHCKTHSPTANFTCSLCGKQFKHAYSLKTHLRVHENGKFSCTICAKVLKSKETLHIHMKRHYKVYNYNCEDCGDTFITPAELTNHRIKHTVEKKIECHICSYKTNLKKSLTIHLKRHMGDKAHKCSFCDKSFYSHGEMVRHMRVHTREKPYSCQTCSQRFTYSSSLNKHMYTVHGLQYKWADVKLKESRTEKLSIVAPT